MDSFELAKTIAPYATTAIKPVVEALLAPKLRRLTSWLEKRSDERDLIAHRMATRFEEYLQRVQEKCGIINTLVFPNQQIELRSIYFPLRLVAVGKSDTTVADDFDLEFFQKFLSKTLISDAAGMGKSTLLRWLCLKAIEQGRFIPIFVELRKLRKGHGLLDEMYAQVDPIGDTFNRDLLHQLLEMGEFVFFLDGYDEIALDDQELVTMDLREFCSKARGNIYVMTSRPEAALSTFGEFQQVSIQPLKRDQAFELIKRYDAIGQSGLGSELIEEISGGHVGVDEFLQRPFLVSLLYKSYLYNRNIPTKKITFYDEIYQALYKQHDLTKDAFKRTKRSGLDLHDFRIVLRRLAFQTAKEGRIEYREAELAGALAEVEGRSPGIEFPIDGFISDLILAVPLFVRDGTTYQWLHKSLQDFFAAEFISTSEHREEILRLICTRHVTKYQNILELYSEMDYASFAKVVAKNIIIRFLEFCSESYEAIPQISGEMLLQRQGLHFGIRLLLTRTEVPSFGKGGKSSGDARGSKHLDTQRSYHIVLGRSLVAMVSVSHETELIDLVLSRDDSLGSPVLNSLAKVKLHHLFRLFSSDEPIELDDSATNPLNAPENFASINKVLAIVRSSIAVGGRWTGRVLDQEKCRRALEKWGDDSTSEEDLAGF